MNEKERNYLNQIKAASETAQVPDALKPEEIERALEKRPKRFVWKRAYTAAMAACCVLACGLAYGTSKSMPDPGTAPSGRTADGAESESLGDGGLETAKSYEEIYQYVKAEQEEMSGAAYAGARNLGVAVDESMDSGSAAGMTEQAAPQAAQESKMMMNAESAQDAKAEYSETNVRQEGVDEADVVKTDGRFIYTLRDNGRALAIVEPDGGQMKKLSEIPLDGAYSVSEFYVKDEKLTLVGGKTREEPRVKRDGWYVEEPNTFALTYDLSDPEKPEKIGEVTQSGYYTSSRMSGGYLYLFSQFGLYGYPEITPRDTDVYIPHINEGLLPEDDIYLPVTKRANTYEVISSIDMKKPDETKDSKAIFTNGGELYVSGKNIYWYENWWNQKEETAIRRISYKDGKLKAESSGNIKGYIHDSFSIDEYKDCLRVITTSGETNNVYVLDKDFEILGSIEGLAKDERVYSARLMGDTGYFVTYKETDPLFSVDFSDPKKPRIVGELKIPGFSEYLHFYGEGKLLGIGMDTEEDGFTTNGVKLSMFDIRDNTDVREMQKYVMENVYSADVLYDYKAALIDTGKNIIGFSAQTGDGERYFVFSYDEGKGFTCLMEEAINGSGYEKARGVFIDEALYVVKGNIIESYSMEDYRKISDIIL